jgi:hypothetical protein
MHLFVNLIAIFRHPLNRDKQREFRRYRAAIKNFGKIGGLARHGNWPDATSLRAACAQLEETVDLAFKVTTEDPHLATILFDEVIGSDYESAASRVLNQYGVALAWVGRLDDAERALRLAFRKDCSALIAYRYGSDLAEQRKHSEASAVFATINGPQPWMAGCSMRSICFPAGRMTCVRSICHFAEL